MFFIIKQTNGMMSEKMVEPIDLRTRSSRETLKTTTTKNQAKTVRINFAQTLENSQRFTTTR